jgi:DNA polymerase III gamma/tau subunit
MLDQMVAFCGEHIRAGDVMDVFGFTPHEVVVRLADSLFAGDAGAALDTVAEQSGLGKDLSRLTAELVSHLRDLLVSQATGGECAIPQGKLLDLVDHFSASEAAMKWVSDKKLQLDVAVIKALHLLDETSLTDVIETLSGLCNGEPPAPRERAPVRVATPQPVPAAPAPLPKTEPTPESLAQTASAPVEEIHTPEPDFPKPPPVVRTPPPVLPKAAPAPQSGSSTPVDAALAWQQIAAEFSKLGDPLRMVPRWYFRPPREWASDCSFPGKPARGGQLDVHGKGDQGHRSPVAPGFGTTHKDSLRIR